MTTAAAQPGAGEEIKVLEKRLAVETARAERVVVEALSGMYRAAGDSRLRKDLRAAKGAEDFVLYEERDKVVNVSRALLAQSPVYSAFIDRMIDYTVGTGLTPVGDGKDSPADLAAKLFMDWADNRADARGMDHFGEQQRKMVRELLAFGDIPVIKTINGSGADAEQELQYIPSALLQNPGSASPRLKPEMNRPRISGGVEMSPNGRPLRYHFASYDASGGSVSAKTRAVDAKYVMFLAWRLWSHQTRGMPWLTHVLERFLDLNEFVDAVVTAAKLQAALAVLVTTKTPGATQSRLTAGTQSVPGLGSSGSERVQNLGDMKPGQVLVLPQGDDAKSIQGSQPNASFDGFVRGILIMAAGGAGLPLEIAMGDYSKANFSIARMARIAGRQTAQPIRKLIEMKFCRPVLEWRVDWLIARGELDAAKRDEYLMVRWQAPAMVPYDPEAEARAAILEIENNLTTKTAVLADRGLDIDRVLPRRSEEKQMERELDIEPPLTPGAGVASDKSTGGDPQQDGGKAAA